MSYVKYLLLTFWPNNLAVLLSASSRRAFHLAGHRRSVAADWNYGVLFFPTENPTLPHRRLALVPGDVSSCHWTRFKLARKPWRTATFIFHQSGCSLPLVFGLADIAERRRVAPWLSAAIANVVLVVLATLTDAQIHRWNDSITLFKHALTVGRSNVIVEDNLGLAMHKSGQFR